MKVIESNITFNKDGLYADHQSRVIEIETWSKYVDQFYKYNGKRLGDFKSVLGGEGVVLPNDAKILDVVDTDHSLFCKLELWDKRVIHKLSYLV